LVDGDWWMVVSYVDDSIKTEDLRNSIQIEMKQLRNLINSLKNKL